MKLTKLAQAVSLICIAAPVFAQTPPRERIEVTGSNIKRIYTEGALPLQVITRQDIDKAGIFSAEELMLFISANGNGLDNLASKTLIVGATDMENRNSTSNSWSVIVMACPPGSLAAVVSLDGHGSQRTFGRAWLWPTRIR